MPNPVSTTSPTVQRIVHDDPAVRAAIQAENRLWGRYGLEPIEHWIPLAGFPIRIRVLEIGSGPPLVFVPGGNGIAAEAVPLIAELDGFRRIAVNLPGGGLSDAIDFRKLDYRALAIETMKTVFDHFGLNDVPVVANSLGCTWTLWFLQTSPDRISNLAFVGCPAFILGTAAPLPMRLLSVPGLNRLLFPLARPPSAEKMRKTFGMLLGTPQEAADRIPDELPETLYRMFRLPTYRLASLSFLETVLTLTGSRERVRLHEDDLRRIKQDTLLIWGARDPFGGVDIGRRVADAMPNALLKVIDAGHVPYIDDPTRCGELIADFLRKPANA